MEKRKRNIKKQFWLNKEESKLLSKKALKVGLSESELIRNLIRGFEPKEKPDDRFYDFVKQIRGISNNINQIARLANYNGFINEYDYKKDAKKILDFIDELKREFLSPKIVE